MNWNKSALACFMLLTAYHFSLNNANQCKFKKTPRVTNHLNAAISLVGEIKDNMKNTHNQCSFYIPDRLKISSTRKGLCDLRRIDLLLDEYLSSCSTHPTYMRIQNEFGNLKETVSRFLNFETNERNCTCHSHGSEAPFFVCDKSLFRHVSLMLHKHRKCTSNKCRERSNPPHLRRCSTSVGEQN